MGLDSYKAVSKCGEKTIILSSTYEVVHIYYYEEIIWIIIKKCKWERSWQYSV